ncbi:thiol:disulfide interchange protein DsbC [Acinetobacter calcoaceticus]|uniref:Thiol:disulfide interchange protein n=1 Tax=Acinetobacter calcoaceticus TaxID=471 RepID=A0A4R1Y796_ACICA|nr:thiol:disulfide interchange protein DsbC [Acinetobacter calcoaceticus]
MKTWLSLITLGLLSANFAHADINTLKQNLQKNFPEMSIKSVNSTPVADIYEVYTADRIVYTNDQARYFFVGNLIDLAAQKNITEERMQLLDAIDVKKLPLEQAIKKVKGNGKRVIYIFSDPDCPYCHKLEEQLAKIDNITIYLFPFPLTSLHPKAEAISKQVWCSKDPYLAWTDYTMKKILPTASANCTNPIAKNIALAEKLDITGTPTFFLKDGRRISGVLAATELESLMDQIK